MSSSTDDLVTIGHVRRAHGLRGDVVVHSDSDHPERFVPGAVLYGDGDRSRPFEVARASSHSDGLLVGFAGVSDRDAAEAIRGMTLTIPLTERRSLDPDEFWLDDLIGVTAVDPAGAVLGIVTGVEFGAAQDRIVVTASDGSPVEVPFVAALVPDVSLESGRIVIDPPEGLFPA